MLVHISSLDSSRVSSGCASQCLLRLHVSGLSVTEVHNDWIHDMSQHSCVVTHSTMDVNALRDAVSDMDRRKVREEVSSAAKSSLDAAASIGAETPMVILRDIRRCILDVEAMMADNERNEDAREQRAEQRHQELIATLQQLTIQSQPDPGNYRRSTSRASIGSISEKRQFYENDTEIKTGAQVVALILMRLDKVLQNSGQLPDSGTKDAVILDLKGWTSPVLKVSAVESIVTSNRTKIVMPKPSQVETITALDIVASTEMGRPQTVRVTDIVRLQQSCPAMMGILEEIRQRIMKCPGIIPEGRRERMSHLKFPYTTREQELNVVAIPSDYLKAGPLVTDSVPKLKDVAKKLYVSEVLEKGTAPIIAYNRSKALN